jgi:DNA polymerase II small subunit/DNA polymerase delta subunit B
MFDMERSDIIKKFLTLGFQLTSDALDVLVKDSELAEQFLKDDKKNIPTTITPDIIKDFQEKQPKKIKKLNINNYTNIFNKRFSQLREIISQKADLENPISISKISQKATNFSIIGMVREVDRETKNVILEDNTSEIAIQIEDSALIKDIVEDEVIGVVCEKREHVLIGAQVFFPDIPMRREINKTTTDKNCLFISDLHMDSESFNRLYYNNYITWLQKQEPMNIFVVGDISSRTEDIEKLLADTPEQHRTTLIRGEIDKGSGKTNNSPYQIQIENTKLFLFHNPKLNNYTNIWGSPEKAITNLLKKRHLDPIFENSNLNENDQYFLETIPDIIVAGHTHIPTSTNYKGTTIITTGSFVTQPIFWLINLRTRELFKKDFS